MSHHPTGTQGNPDVGRSLRIQMLTTPYAAFGIGPTADYPRVYGVLMDWPINGDTATVVSFCDGNASLYTTSAFGVIGGGGSDAVRERAQAFVQHAARFVDAAAPTSEFPYPERHLVRFYLLTFDDVRVIDADLQAVQNGEDPYAALFNCGQAVLTELRRAAQVASPGERAPRAPHKQPSGVSAYVNCLLTALSSGVPGPVEIAASEPVPNLVDLAVGHKELREWIEAELRPFRSLDAKKVIRALAQNAKLGGPPFSIKRGELRTVHVQEGGKHVARLFDVQIGRWNRSASVALAADDDPRAIAFQHEIDAEDAAK